MNDTILIVDDEKKVIQSIKRSLMDETYSIISAISAEEGLAKLQKYEVDLVMSDVRMPGMNGIEFLKKVQLDYPHVLTMALTAYADLEMVVEAINEAGVYKFILKPWDDNELRLTIRSALESLRASAGKNSSRNRVKKREAAIKELEKKYPGITKVTRDEDGNVLSGYDR